MIESPKRMIAVFVPWMFASVCLYAVAVLYHLRSVQVLAFLALWISVVFFVLSYRSVAQGHKFPVKIGARISAWATFVAAAAYLALSRWP
jgi:hypothetical protein